MSAVSCRFLHITNGVIDKKVCKCEPMYNVYIYIYMAFVWWPLVTACSVVVVQSTQYSQCFVWLCLMHVVCILKFVAMNLHEKLSTTHCSIFYPFPTWKVEVQPYVLDDQVCKECHGRGRYAPYFCGNIHCLSYYCEHCWIIVHAPRITNASLKRMETDRGPSTYSHHSHIWCPRQLQQQAAGTDSPSPLPLPSPLHPNSPSCVVGVTISASDKN